MTSNSHQTAQRNEIHILICLNRFGWLKTRQIASLVWPASADGGGYSMAQRTLRRLKKARRVVAKVAPDGATVYAMGRGGARYLYTMEGLETRTTTDGMRTLANYKHRTRANDLAIQAITIGRAAWTEYEIQTGKAPVRVLRGKVPDLLLDWSHRCATGEDEVVLAWVEVENSYKANRELDKLLSFFCEVLGAVDGSGAPRQTMEPLNETTSLGFGVIVIQTHAELNRILSKLATKQMAEPYAYAWNSIGYTLYIQMGDDDAVPLEEYSFAWQG